MPLDEDGIVVEDDGDPYLDAEEALAADAAPVKVRLGFAAGQGTAAGLGGD